jgi:hypothetical protein
MIWLGDSGRLCLASCHCTRSSYIQKVPILLATSVDVNDINVIIAAESIRLWG